MNTLERFYAPWQASFRVARAELGNGRKESHWMWYIFPQLRGLGYSETAHYYGIADLEEARRFLADPLLGAGLRELSALLLELDTDEPEAVFPYPDNLKLCSSMTLFAAAGEEPLFEAVLQKFFGGEPDQRTLEKLNKGEET